MKSAKLEPEEVTRIIIQATMTVPSDTGLVDVLSKRVRAGFTDLGCHFFIANNGNIHSSVPVTHRGTSVQRYSKSSTHILINGGSDRRGRPENNYSEEQLHTLRWAVNLLTNLYPHAKPTMYRELFRGVNPVIDHEDY